MSVDINRREEAFKILGMVFITITLFANMWLLSRYWRVKGVFNYPNHCIRVLSTLGSLALVAFSYVIETRLYFDDESMSCRTILISDVYRLHFFPFVFGCGTLLQGFLNCFQKSYASCNRKVFSFVISIILWVLGLAAVGPLSILDTDWDDRCERNFKKERLWAIEVVSVIVPASFALLSALVLSSLTGKGWPITSNMEHYDVEIPQMTLEQINGDPTVSNSSSPNEETTGNDTQTQPRPQEIPVIIPENNTVIKTVFIISPVTEMRCIIFANLIFFLSVMPRACFYLAHLIDLNEPIEEDDLKYVIINDICHWLYFIYPVLVPLVWSRLIRDETVQT